MNFFKAADKGSTAMSKAATAGPTEKSVFVCFRMTEFDKKGMLDGRQVLPQTVATCRELINFVKPQLEGVYGTLGISTRPNLIVWESEKPGKKKKPKPPVEKCPRDLVQEGKIYTIFECWMDEIPLALLRRVRFDDAESTTYTDPSKRSPFTMLSPLSCAALRKRQNEHLVGPWCRTLRDGSVNPSGISLSMINDATALQEAVDPFRSIEHDETAGVTSITLEQYHSLIPPNETLDPERGVLFSSISHDDFGAVRGEDSEVKAPEDADFKISHRMVNVDCELATGFNVSKHGTMLVWDNSHSGHVTLTRLRDFPVRRHWLTPGDAAKQFGPFLPDNFHEQAQQALSNNDLEAFDTALRNALAVSPGQEPETFKLTPPCLNQQRAIALPKLASCFTPVSIRMEAKAEPRPVQQHRKDSQLKVQMMITGLYDRARHDSLTLQLIDRVQEQDYDEEKLSDWDCALLVEAIHELLDEFFEDTDLVDDLNAGLAVLEQRLDSPMSSATPATPAPSRSRHANASSQTDSPDSNVSGNTAALSEHSEQDLDMDLPEVANMQITANYSSGSDTNHSNHTAATSVGSGNTE